MRRLRDTRLPPLAWVAIAAGVTAVLRLAAALLVETPIYYPDEYLNTAISRGFAVGDLGEFRGGSIHATYSYTAYLAPLLQAPLWLLDDVDVAYRLAQALGVFVFAAAAFPAYAIARRLGISGNGALLVALLTLTIPAGALTVTLLSEPYGYALFLAALLLALDAITRPSPARHLAVVAAAILLCFAGGLQFIVFGLAYVGAWVVLGRWSLRHLLRRLAILAGAAAAVLAIAFAAGRGHYVDTFLHAVTYYEYPWDEIAVWLVINVFVLSISAGWVLVPGALLGLRALGASAERPLRAFSVLSVFLLAGMLAEAALWSSSGQGVYERFVFYAAPLLALSFVWAGERLAAPRRIYAAVAYAAALAAVLLPVLPPLRGANDDHSPTLMGLALLDIGDGASGLIWAPALVLLAFGTAVAGTRHPKRLAAIAVTVCALTTVGSSAAFIGLSDKPDAPPRLHAPSGTTILTWSGTNQFLLEKALFWNPAITDVAVFGGGRAADPFPFIQARLDPSGALLDEEGARLGAPFAIGPDTLAIGGGATGRERAQFVTLPGAPSLLAFGWYRRVGHIGSAGLILAAAGERPARLTVRLRTRRGSKTIRFYCGDTFRRTVDVDADGTSTTIPVLRNSVRSCRFAMTRGRLEAVGGQLVSAEASLSLDS